jgi:hypothetical protein
VVRRVSEFSIGFADRTHQGIWSHPMFDLPLFRIDDRLMSLAFFCTSRRIDDAHQWLQLPGDDSRVFDSALMRSVSIARRHH